VQVRVFVVNHQPRLQASNHVCDFTVTARASDGRNTTTQTFTLRVVAFDTSPPLRPAR